MGENEIYDSFSCSDPELSRTNITDEVWMMRSNVTEHEVAVLVQAIIQTLFVAIGIPWNTIVFISIMVEKLYKEPTYVLLLNLVIADVLVYICVLPFNIETAFAQEFTIGNSDFIRCGVCQAIIVIILVLVYVSLFTLALMSVDRFIYIKWPLHYRRHVTMIKILVSLLLVWFFCIAFSILPVFGVGEIKFSTIISSCSLITRGSTQLIKNSTFVLILVAVGLFPFTTILICNIWIMIIIYRTAHGKFNKKRELNNFTVISSDLRRNAEKELKANYHRQQIHLVRLFGALFVANFIVWVPTIIIAILSAAIGSEKIPYSLSTLQYLAYVSQPVIHPMLETCLFSRARTSIIKCLCYCCHRNIKGLPPASASMENTLKSLPISEDKNSVEVTSL